MSTMFLNKINTVEIQQKPITTRFISLVSFDLKKEYQLTHSPIRVPGSVEKSACPQIHIVKLRLSIDIIKL